MFDLLLNRYGNLDYIMNVDQRYGLKLAIKAIKAKADDRLYSRWLIEKDRLKRPMTYTEYKRYFMPEKIDVKEKVETKQRIDEERKRIDEKFKKKVSQ